MGQMSPESIDLRSHQGDLEFKTVEIERRRQHLITTGLRKEQVESLFITRPALFDPSTVDNQLDLLKNLGFTDPIKMVTTHPVIFGYAEENIRGRIRLFSRLIRQYNLPLSPVTMLEKESGLFSTKLDKIWTLTRIIREYQPLPQEVTQSLISTLVRNNLEDVLVTFSQPYPNNELVTDFIKRVRKTKAEGLSKEDKRKIIEEQLDTTIRANIRYLRGYPSK